MVIADARSVARGWVRHEVAGEAGYRGAYLSGSAAWLPDDARLPRTSDVDVVVVLGPGGRPGPGGKLLAGGVLLDVSYVSAARVESAERVLADYQLASAFSRRNVLDDPTGSLRAVQKEVAAAFATPDRISARIGAAEAKVRRYLGAVRSARSLPDRALAWLFGTGVTTHLLLVAGLRNPTVRRRYADVRDLLAERHRLEVHEILLALLGCDAMAPDGVRRHLRAMAEAFDLVAAVSDPPVPYASDLRAPGRPIAVDGSEALIEAGLHREAVFWIAVTLSRCVVVGHLPTAGLRRADVERLDAAYLDLLADLGAASADEIDGRVAIVRTSLPGVRAVADRLAATAPARGPGPSRGLL